MNRTTKVGMLMLVAMPVTAAAAATEKGRQHVIAVEDRRWTLDIGEADARHPSWLYPSDSLQPDGMRVERQKVPAPRELPAMDLRLSYRLPKGAGRLTGRIFVENAGDSVDGNVGVAIPYELPDGRRGTEHRYVNSSIQPLTSHHLSWSRTFFDRGTYALQHELGFVSHRLDYGISNSSLGQSSHTALKGPRLGLTATRRLAYGAAFDVVIGCTAARHTEHAYTSVPVSYPGLSTYLVTDATAHSWRLVPDASLALRIPLSRRLAGTLAYRWEGYGRTFVGRASTYGAFVALRIGIGS
jgi:hypothetical protein